MRGEEKRKARRVQVRWPISALTSEGTILGETRNVSTRGAFILCQKPLPLKEECLLTLRGPSESVQINASVVWSDMDACGEEEIPAGMGVSFIWV